MSPQPTVLVTAFGPFGEFECNSSFPVVQGLHAPELGINLQRATLPAAYERGWFLLKEYLDELNPDLVIMFGMSAKTNVLKLERRAVNWTSSKARDVDGHAKRGVILSGSTDLKTSLSVEDAAVALRRMGVPYEVSDSAGNFVCNELWFRALDFLATVEVPPRAPSCGFVHVPFFGRLCTLDRSRVHAGAQMVLDTASADLSGGLA